MTRFRSDGTPVGERDGDLLDEGEYTSGAGYAGAGSASDFDTYSADIPIWGWLSGANARMDAMRAEREAARNQEYWDQLTNYMPTADDLAVDYLGEDYVGGDPSDFLNQEREGRAGMLDALDVFGEYARTPGFTEADRAMMGETSREERMRARGDREAALAAMEARGMGGGGADLMSRMGADEAAAGRASSRNTSMMAAAQARQMDAARAMADIGGAISGADDRRSSALDAWSARETDYRRGLEGRNTERENRSRESRADANQSAYENRERAVAGATNQYSTDASRRAREGDREDENDRALASGIGSILENL